MERCLKVLQHETPKFSFQKMSNLNLNCILTYAELPIVSGQNNMIQAAAKCQYLHVLCFHFDITTAES